MPDDTTDNSSKQRNRVVVVVVVVVKSDLLRWTLSVLVGHDPPPVELLLVDPAWPLEGLWSQFRLHRREGYWEAGGRHEPFSRWRQGSLACQLPVRLDHPELSAAVKTDT